MASGYFHFADYNTTVHTVSVMGTPMPVYVLNNPNPGMVDWSEKIIKPVFIDFYYKDVQCVDFSDPNVKSLQNMQLPTFYEFHPIQGTTNYYISNTIVEGAGTLNILFGIGENGIAIAFVLNFPNT